MEDIFPGHLLIHGKSSDTIRERAKTIIQHFNPKKIFVICDKNAGHNYDDLQYINVEYLEYDIQDEALYENSMTSVTIKSDSELKSKLDVVLNNELYQNEDNILIIDCNSDTPVNLINDEGMLYYNIRSIYRDYDYIKTIYLHQHSKVYEKLPPDRILCYLHTRLEV